VFDRVSDMMREESIFFRRALKTSSLRDSPSGPGGGVQSHNVASKSHGIDEVAEKRVEVLGSEERVERRQGKDDGRSADLDDERQRELDDGLEQVRDWLLIFEARALRGWLVRRAWSGLWLYRFRLITCALMIICGHVRKKRREEK